MKYTLPNMEHKFSIQIVGEETGINWVGDFVYKRPSLQERSRIDVMRARLNGDMFTVDEDVKAYNEAISHLRHTLREFPEWWREADFGGNLYDSNVILDIYNKCMAFEAEWSERVHGGKSEKVKADKLQSEESV